jgi:hypothetical protein
VNPEFIGEKEYFEALSKTEGTWVLMTDDSVFVLKNNTGNTLFAWSSDTRASEFAEKNGSTSLKPVFFPLSNLISGLINKESAEITEVAISAKKGLPALTYEKQEFVGKCGM